MKKISRMLVFSGVGLYATSLWNGGFTVSLEPKNFLLLTVAVALLYYLLTPLTKIVLFPLNFLTFGLFSVFLNSFLFYLIVRYFSTIISIEKWRMPEVKWLFFEAGPIDLGFIANVFVCALSVYLIINLLERLV